MKSSRQQYIFVIIGILFLISATLLYGALTQETKPDPVSEDIIRKAVSRMIPKDPNQLTDDDFAQIKNLDIENSQEPGPRYFGPTPTYHSYEFSDIRMLVKFTNLQKLNLIMIHFPESKIPEWMKILSKLGIYDINKKRAIDLSPLSKLNHLEELTLGGPAIRELRPIAGLNIKHLELVNVSASDIKPILNLKQLQTLYISNCPNIKDEDIEILKKTFPNIVIFPPLIYL